MALRIRFTSSASATTTATPWVISISTTSTPSFPAFPVFHLLGSGGSSPPPSPQLCCEGNSDWRIPSTLEDISPQDTPVPRVLATRLSEVRVVVFAICAIAPANEWGWTDGLLIWEGMSWVRAVSLDSSSWVVSLREIEMSGSGVSPPVSLPNLKLVSRISSSFGVPSKGPQQLLSGVLSLLKIRSLYLIGAGLSRMKWSSSLWVSPHCRALKLKLMGMMFGLLLLLSGSPM